MSEQYSPQYITQVHNFMPGEVVTARELNTIFNALVSASDNSNHWLDYLDREAIPAQIAEQLEGHIEEIATPLVEEAIENLTEDIQNKTTDFLNERCVAIVIDDHNAGDGTTYTSLINAIDTEHLRVSLNTRGRAISQISSNLRYIPNWYSTNNYSALSDEDKATEARNMISTLTQYAPGAYSIVCDHNEDSGSYNVEGVAGFYLTPLEYSGVYDTCADFYEYLIQQRLFGYTFDTASDFIDTLDDITLTYAPVAILELQEFLNNVHDIASALTAKGIKPVFLSNMVHDIRFSTYSGHSVTCDVFNYPESIPATKGYYSSSNHAQTRLFLHFSPLKDVSNKTIEITQLMTRAQIEAFVTEQLGASTTTLTAAINAGDASTLTAANNYTDTASAAALASAKAYSDTKIQDTKDWVDDTAGPALLASAESTAQELIDTALESNPGYKPYRARLTYKACSADSIPKDADSHATCTYDGTFQFPTSLANLGGLMFNYIPFAFEYPQWLDAGITISTYGTLSLSSTSDNHITLSLNVPLHSTLHGSDVPATSLETLIPFADLVVWLPDVVTMSSYRSRLTPA